MITFAGLPLVVPDFAVTLCSLHSVSASIFPASLKLVTWLMVITAELHCLQVTEVCRRDMQCQTGCRFD